MEKLNEMELAYLQKGIEQERKGVAYTVSL